MAFRWDIFGARITNLSLGGIGGSAIIWVLDF